MESNIRALVLLNWLNSLRESHKMFGKPRIKYLFPTRLINASLAIYIFFPTRLIHSIKHEHSCEILYESEEFAEYNMAMINTGLDNQNVQCKIAKIEDLTCVLMFYEFKGLQPNKKFLKVLKVPLGGLLMYRA